MKQNNCGAAVKPTRWVATIDCYREGGGCVDNCAFLPESVTGCWGQSPNAPSVDYNTLQIWHCTTENMERQQLCLDYKHLNPWVGLPTGHLRQTFLITYGECWSDACTCCHC